MQKIGEAIDCASDEEFNRLLDRLKQQRQVAKMISNLPPCMYEEFYDKGDPYFDDSFGPDLDDLYGYFDNFDW